MYANFNIMSKHTHTYSKIKRICQSLINWNAMFIKLCNMLNCWVHLTLWNPKGGEGLGLLVDSVPRDSLKKMLSQFHIGCIFCHVGQVIATLGNSFPHMITLLKIGWKIDWRTQLQQLWNLEDPFGSIETRGTKIAHS